MNSKLTNKLLSIKVGNKVCEYVGLLPSSDLTRKAFSICLESPTISLSKIKKLVPIPSSTKKVIPSYCPEIMALPKCYRAWAHKEYTLGINIEDVVVVVGGYGKYRGRFKNISKYRYEELRVELEKIKAAEENVCVSRIYEDDDYVCVRLDNIAAAVKYGKGTKWCISSTKDKYDRFNEYINNGAVFYYVGMKKEDSRKNRFAKIVVDMHEELIYDAMDDEYESIWESKNIDLVSKYVKEIEPIMQSDYKLHSKTYMYRLMSGKIKTYTEILKAAKELGKDKVLELLVNFDQSMVKIPLEFFPDGFDFSRVLHFLKVEDLVKLAIKEGEGGKDVSEYLNYVGKSNLHKLIPYKMNDRHKMYIVNYGNSNCIGKMVNYTKNKNILKALYSRLRHNLRCTKVLKEIKAKLNKYGEK